MSAFPEADKIAQKDTEAYNTVIAWLRTQISFELLRSVQACVRGSRTLLRLQNKRHHCGHLKFFRAIFKLNAFVLYMILNFYEISYINFINCIL